MMSLILRASSIILTSPAASGTIAVRWVGFFNISHFMTDESTPQALVSFADFHLPSHMRMHPCSVGKNVMHVPMMSFILMASSSILHHLQHLAQLLLGGVIVT